MRKRRLSQYKQDRLIEHFVEGSTARTAARLCGVNRKQALFLPAPSIKPYERASGKENEAAGPQVKSLYLAY